MLKSVVYESHRLQESSNDGTEAEKAAGGDLDVGSSARGS
jgi:hypothetical protein